MADLVSSGGYDATNRVGEKYHYDPATGLWALQGQGHAPPPLSEGSPSAPQIRPSGLTRSMAAAAPPSAGRAQTVAFWMGKGAPQHVAEGIADRVNAESSFNPLSQGDYKDGRPTSLGLYQHHAERKAQLLAMPNWQDPMTQHQLAYKDVTGGDSIATRHWQEILNAPDRATAAKLWDKYFERSKGGPGASGGQAGASISLDRRMPGRLGGMGPRVPGLTVEAPGGAPIAAKPQMPVQPPPAPPQQQEVPPATAAPQQVAALPAPLFPAQSPQPVAAPQVPSLHGAYQNAIASILSGRRRPQGSQFG